mmetsp:Transcript_38430/g.89329  ORF Transcript_38430/g.89329 Transcript_38430/m.89329 type:complete len:634 (-) Transcript_38430:319-2220(-)
MVARYSYRNDSDHSSNESTVKVCVVKRGLRDTPVNRKNTSQNLPPTVLSHRPASSTFGRSTNNISNISRPSSTTFGRSSSNVFAKPEPLTKSLSFGPKRVNPSTRLKRNQEPVRSKSPHPTNTTTYSKMNKSINRNAGSTSTPKMSARAVHRKNPTVSNARTAQTNRPKSPFTNQKNIEVNYGNSRLRSAAGAVVGPVESQSTMSVIQLIGDANVLSSPFPTKRRTDEDMSITTYTTQQTDDDVQLCNNLNGFTGKYVPPEVANEEEYLSQENSVISNMLQADSVVQTLENNAEIKRETRDGSAVSVLLQRNREGKTTGRPTGNPECSHSPVPTVRHHYDQDQSAEKYKSIQSNRVRWSETHEVKDFDTDHPIHSESCDDYELNVNAMQHAPISESKNHSQFSSTYQPNRTQNNAMEEKKKKNDLRQNDEYKMEYQNENRYRTREDENDDEKEKEIENYPGKKKNISTLNQSRTLTPLKVELKNEGRAKRGTELYVVEHPEFGTLKLEFQPKNNDGNSDQARRDKDEKPEMKLNLTAIADMGEKIFGEIGISTPTNKDEKNFEDSDLLMEDTPKQKEWNTGDSKRSLADSEQNIYYSKKDTYEDRLTLMSTSESLWSERTKKKCCTSILFWHF